MSSKKSDCSYMTARAIYANKKDFSEIAEPKKDVVLKLALFILKLDTVHKLQGWPKKIAP